MRTEAGLLVAVAVISGLGLLAQSGPPRPVRRSAVPTRPATAPPPSPMVWEPWPVLAAASEVDAGGEGAAQIPATPPSGATAYAAPPGAAGIWSTPAEFAPSD